MARSDQRGELRSLPFRVTGSVWVPINGGKRPHIPETVRSELNQWIHEVRNGAKLAANGERVMPVLLVGETRCGKTSAAGAFADSIDHFAARLSIADVVGSHLGESASKLTKAFEELDTGTVWIFDELDAITGTRSNSQEAAGQERAHSIGTLLTLIESVRPEIPIVATTNVVDNIDPAVLGRFRVVFWPRWSELSGEERRAFTATHGAPDVTARSYAEAVQKCRSARVAAIIGPAPGQVTQSTIPGTLRRRRI